MQEEGRGRRVKVPECIIFSLLFLHAHDSAGADGPVEAESNSVLNFRPRKGSIPHKTSFQSSLNLCFKCCDWPDDFDGSTFEQ